MNRFRALLSLAGFGVVGAVIFTALASPPPSNLIKDINSTAVRVSGDPSGRSFEVGGLAYFVAETAANGRELWRTDGTTTGTQLVADISPGPRDSNPYPVAAVNGKLVFVAQNVSTGGELWVTDGTTAGTSLLRDFWPGPLSGVQNGYESAVMNGILYFIAYDPTVGAELWRTDGTAAGTSLVIDFRPGVDSSPYVLDLTPFNGALYFGGYSATTGFELWRTDGTAANTVLVKDLNPGTADGIASGTLTAAASFLYFSGNDGLSGFDPWATDGTATNTRKLADAHPGITDSSTGVGVANGTRVVFTTHSGWTANTRTVWVTNGTSSGTGSLKSGVSYISDLFAAGARWIFFAESSTTGMEPWGTDGTLVGTVLLKDIVVGTGSSNPFVTRQFPETSAPFAMFSASEATGSGTYASDGTVAGTVRIGTGRAGVATMIGSTAYLTFSSTATGAELYRTNGTLAGTTLVKDLVAGAASSSPTVMGKLGTTVLFNATDALMDSELYRTDGTATGTYLLKDTEPGITSGSSNPRNGVRVGTVAVFVAQPNANTELWRTDGTDAGTFSIAPGMQLMSDTSGPTLGGQLYFRGRFGSGPTELYRTDGTTATPITTGITTNVNAVLGSVGGYVYFAGTTAAAGSELWRTDGTPQGTTMVADLYSGTFGSDPTTGAVLGNKLVFFGYHNLNGFSPFVTDGTPTGTQNLGYVAISGSSTPRASGVLVSGDTAYFAIGTSGPYDVVATDGTPAGTAKVNLSSNMYVQLTSLTDWVPVGTRSIVAATQFGSFGREPAVFTGTAAPVLLKDLASGGTDSSPREFLSTGSRVYFVAYAGHTAIIETDGTPAGTREVDATNLPNMGALSRSIVGAAGEELLFSAYGTDGGHLWRTVFADGGAVSLGGPALPTRPLFTTFHGRTFFATSEQYYGGALWYSDGTPEGTAEVPGEGRDPRGLVVLPTRVVFSARDVFRDYELYGADLDNSPPTVAPVVSGTLGANGFYVSDVSVDWDAGDRESPMQLTGCSQSQVTMDTAGTTFTCVAQSLGGSTSASVTIMRDGTAPVLGCADVTVEAVDGGGAECVFADPTVTDTVDAAPVVQLSADSGTLMPLGATSITARATDSAGNESACSFSCTVRDTTAPTVACPSAIDTVVGVATDFGATASDSVDPTPLLTYSPVNPGGTFAAGATVVTVIATDFSGNAGTCSFTVNAVVPYVDAGVPDAGSAATDAGTESPGDQPDAGEPVGPVAENPSEPDAPAGCGCSGGASGIVPFGLFALMLGVARRRRSGVAR